jgi:membrane associated rhomboid family serine protease
MFVIPFSTDVHDGKIRLAGIEIIGVCLIVHLFVSADMGRVNRDISQAVTSWQQERAERHTHGAARGYDAGERENNEPRDPLTDDFDFRNDPAKELQARIKEVRKTSLLYRLGLVLSDFKLYAVITSMFTHGGWLHLIGNMLFFYVCGLAMEQYWGYWRFLIIYLACGIVAEASYAVCAAAAGTAASGIPLVGASGAIAGAMGAFFATHSRVKVKLFYLVGFWWRGVWAVPAYLFLGFWFLQQVFAAIQTSHQSSGVAYTAHIGGFIAGALFGKLIASDYESSVVDPVLARRQERAGGSGQESVIPMGFTESPAEAGAASRPLASAAPVAAKSTDTTSLEAAKAENYPVETAEMNGWEALSRQNSPQATRLLSYAMTRYLQDPERNRSRLVLLFGKIIKEHRRLLFSQNQYYQWGKQLMAAREFKFAIVCFDMAAFREGNPHIQKNSLLEAARLRLATSYQFDKIRRDMEYLLTIEPQGIFANQARETLQKLQDAGQPKRTAPRQNP